MTLTEAQIKHMVDRFLMWRLPEHFRPDGGISFKANFNENTAWPMKHQPVGTNLFDATQADAMVRHMLDGVPTAAATKYLRETLSECLDYFDNKADCDQPSGEAPRPNEEMKLFCAVKQALEAFAPTATPSSERTAK